MCNTCAALTPPQKKKKKKKKEEKKHFVVNASFSATHGRMVTGCGRALKKCQGEN